jgi:hypothetical protein
VQVFKIMADTQADSTMAVDVPLEETPKSASGVQFAGRRRLDCFSQFMSNSSQLPLLQTLPTLVQILAP